MARSGQAGENQFLAAYYTAGDVAEYIVRCTVAPLLLDRLLQRRPELSAPGGSLRRLLAADLPRYLFEAARRGLELAPPAAVLAGRSDPAQRGAWDTPLPSGSGLPGEVWREWLLRQASYAELRERIAAGPLDGGLMISANLNTPLLLADLLHDPALASEVHELLLQLCVLDPTCGDGAFLLATMDLLLPLYQACAPLESPEQQIEQILLHNLYGVDLSQQAVEICRQRLLTRLPGSNTDLRGRIVCGNALTGRLHGVAPAAETDAGGPALDWDATFAAVLARGGFDVILGNPPYIDYTPERFPYQLHGYSMIQSGNLYPCLVERCVKLLHPQGSWGMILPLAGFATRRMAGFIAAFRQWFPQSWVSFYHFRPGMLFDQQHSASIPTAIAFGRPAGAEQRWSTGLGRWQSEQRGLLFATRRYCRIDVPLDPDNPHYYPKFGQPLENRLLRRILEHPPIGGYRSREPNQNAIYYRSAGGLYWKVVVNFAWPYPSSSNKQAWFAPQYDRDVFVALLNSSLFWWYYSISFDSFNLKDYMLFGFRCAYPHDPTLRAALSAQTAELMQNYRTHAEHLRRGASASYTIYARHAKPILDRIDTLLAEHYGLSAEELDFILSYDLKYRLGAQQ